MQRAAAQITTELRSRRDWLGIPCASPSSKEPPVRILDYACGTGMITRAFAPFATHLTGIDISAAMVAEYNHRCSALLASENPLGASMHAIVGDLCDPAGVAEALRGEELFGFDMAVVGMGFHHFEHLELSLRRLVERVKRGGVVVVVDGQGHEHGKSSDHNHGSEESSANDMDSVFAAAAPFVPHQHGFSRAGMETLFTAAGCTDFDFLVMAEPILFGDGENPARMRGFIAKGRRA